MTDWVNLRKHIDHVVADEGQWVGLFDEDGEWIMRLPVGSLSAQSTLRKAGDLSLTFPTVGRWGQVHRAVNVLVSEDVGRVGPDGALVANEGPQRMVVVCREGSRRAFLTTHPHAPVDAFKLPHSLTIPGVDLLDMLAMWPAPSVPSKWDSQFRERSEDAGGEYETPRTYAPVEFATKADGYTMHGPAEKVIRDTVQDSLDATNALMGWSSDPHMVVDYSDPSTDSPNALLRVQDRPLLDTIQQTAAFAGVVVVVDLWWPGDEQIRVRLPNRTSTALRSWDRPIAVCRINQSEEAS